MIVANGAPDSRLPPESWLVVLLRGLALAVAAAAVLLEVSLPAGTAGAIVGTVAATVVAHFVARSRARLWVVWAVALGAGAAGLAIGGLLVDGTWAPSLLGLHGAMAAQDLVRFGLGALGLVLALRVSAARFSVVSVVELALIALALAGVVAAHRDGAINHPRALTDWALTTGRDPVQILLYCGAGTIGALALASLRERRGRGVRVFLHLGTAAAIALLALFMVRVYGTPKPPRGAGLGLDKGRPDKTRGQRSDQLDQLEFKNDYGSQSQDAPVAVVLLHDDYSPPLGYYYFRQTAFTQYNGHRLVARTRDDIDEDIVTDFPTAPLAVKGAPQPGPERALVRTTVALLADHLKPFGLESPTEFQPRESADENRFQRVYDVTSLALALKYEELLGRKTTQLDRVASVYTELPDDPRYKQLADEIIARSLKPEYQHDPFAQAIAISAWLGKNSIYSRRSQHADAEDPTADFLFGDKIGYCVHFSHAAAYLLRARGLPARIAAGYVADEGRKGSGSTIMLRQKDAHAWAELYLDGFGWIIVDVAPERVLDPPDTPPDQELQRMLGELARGDKQAGRLKPQTERPGPSLAQIGRLLALLIAGALWLLYAVKVWRTIAPGFAGARSIHRVAYRATLDRLAETGWRRAPGETRERFAARVGAVAPTLEPLTREHVGRAFGARTLAPIDEVRRLARETVVEARRRAPWWRLVLGFLNPLSWMLSR